MVKQRTYLYKTNVRVKLRMISTAVLENFPCTICWKTNDLQLINKRDVIDVIDVICYGIRHNL